MNRRKFRYELELYENDILLSNLVVMIQQRPHWPPVQNWLDFPYEWECRTVVENKVDEETITNIVMKTDKLRFLIVKEDQIMEEWIIPGAKLKAIFKNGIIFYNDEDEKEVIEMKWNHEEIVDYKSWWE